MEEEQEINWKRKCNKDVHLYGETENGKLFSCGKKVKEEKDGDEKWTRDESGG